MGQEVGGGTKNALVIVLFFAIVACLAYVCVSTGGDSGPEHSEGMAWVMCEGFVEKRLKAPSTADFPRYDQDNVEHEGDGRYTISAYVDAENSFGAKMRVPFDCVVQYKGEDRWRLIDIHLYE